METDNKIETRLNDLIEKGETLRQGEDEGGAFDETHKQNCSGWIAAARSVTQFVLPNSEALYRKHIEEVASKDHGWLINNAVGEITELLKHLLSDFDNGLLFSIINQTRAEVFDDFLDHARAYLADGRKNEAGVIAGVVFEDTLRRICKNHKIEESGEKLDNVISELSKAGIITGIMAKRARACAHVRTKATHAQWDEFEVGDVEATITFTDELILKKVDSAG
jgi:hypothetical protein